MEEIDSSPAAANVKKRPAPDEEDSPEKRPLNLKGTQFMMPTPPDTDQSSNASPTVYQNAAARDVSPAPSSTTLSSITSSHPAIAFEMTSTANPSATAASSDQPPKKKRKLTPSEKIEQQREKEAKAVEKAAEKARKLAEKERKDAEKAEEKGRKDEEKRIKDEEKRKKADEKEEKKRDKEIKEEEKVQEKLKKERSQMRLGAFFQKPATPTDEPGCEGSTVRARRRSLSLEPFDAVADEIRQSESPCKKAVQALTAREVSPPPAISDYQKYFLPFQLQTHTSLASDRISTNPGGAQEAFEYQLEDPLIREKYDLGLVYTYAGLERQFAHERQCARGRHLPSMRELVDQINGSSDQPIDLTSDASMQDPMEAIQAVSRRYIAFEQDVRPAYFGTYTRIRSPRTVRKLSRNPFTQARPDTDYDYDSEAEWEEPEEGEDLVDEEDDEAESVGDANEMDEFLDDEEDALKNRRKLISGDLIPTNTGICWENESGRTLPSVPDGTPMTVMRGMRMGVLLPGFSGQTIDPFSTSYWESEAPSAATSKTQPNPIASDELMPPPRQPLHPRPNVNGTLDHFVGGAAASAKPAAASSQTKGTRIRGAQTTLSKEDMEEFKGFVVGSQAAKADLLRDLKAKFPKLTNDAIKTTLNDNFAPVGASKVERKWGFVSVS